jgi:hypothetical protein
MTTAWEPPVLAEDELHEIESRIVNAFETRSTDGLNVLGFGELGLAIGWPTAEPRMVVKRQTVGTPETVRADLDRMQAYHDALETRELPVLPTELRTIRLDSGADAAYVVQPLVQRDDLVEHILPTVTPEAFHPILVAIRDAVIRVVHDGPEGGLSVDAQVTNFAWTGDSVTIIDTTPPLVWGPNGGPFYDVGNYLLAIPAPLRPAAMKITRQQGDRVRSATGALTQTCVFLKRIELDEWVDPAIETFNAALPTPIVRAEVEKLFGEATKNFPLIKLMARIQRFWQTKIRRGEYQYFITNSFSGEIL